MSQTLLNPINELNGNSGRWMTMIFNNDITSMDEVMLALMTATQCSVEEAEIETWEAHTYGKAAVHFATESECREVATIISSVGVQTAVTPEWND
jgi:ATP-dependent Clp protease adapter protein ClpS